jgi:hypothetical protein
MNRLRDFGAFLYAFIVGDDPLIAVTVVAALALTALIAGSGTAAWWVLPLAVVLVLAVSVQRATAGRATTTIGPQDEPADHQGQERPT